MIKIKQRARDRSLRDALKEAHKINKETDRKVLIYLVKGEFQALTKQEMKALWHRGFFKPWTIQQIESMAYLDVSTRKIIEMANNKPADKKLSDEQIKKLQEETEKKKNQTIKK